MAQHEISPILRLVEPPKPDLNKLLAANDDDYGPVPAGVALASAYGGRIGIAVMVLVAIAIGAVLAAGRI